MDSLKINQTATALNNTMINATSAAIQKTCDLQTELNNVSKIYAYVINRVHTKYLKIKGSCLFSHLLHCSVQIHY